MIKFFEPIKISAMHIYHSALELCPTSSIVRKLYYERCNRIAFLPRVVVGTLDSWDKVVSVPNKGDFDYWIPAWSPCSQFIAAQTENVIEIRSQLTLEVFTTLQPTDTALNLTGQLAYSPDGCFLACSSDGFILIWDIQTGGVVGGIECDFYPTSLTWSLDGRAVGVIRNEAGRVDVIIYDVASGRRLFTGTLHSEDESCRSEYLWAYKESFLVITMQQTNLRHVVAVKIFEVQHVPVNIHSFSLTTSSLLEISFSPATCRIAFLDKDVLRIFENWNSACILEETGRFWNHEFSSDGSLFVAFKDSNVHIWRYGSCHFLPWKKFPLIDGTLFFRFSPNLSSVVERSKSTLNVWRLHDLPPLSTPTRPPQVGLTLSGQIVQRSGNFITILNPHSRPSRVPVVDAGAEIEGFVLTGNVLLAALGGVTTAWLVPPAGFVDDPFGRRLVDRGDALWTVRGFIPLFGVAGKIGSIEGDSGSRIFYHTETGDALNLDYSTTEFHRKYLTGYLNGNHYSHFHNLPQTNALPGGGWQTSREGWVKDSEGRCRLWLLVNWRGDWRAEDWRDDTTTQFSIIQGAFVVVKF